MVLHKDSHFANTTQSNLNSMKNSIYTKKTHFFTLLNLGFSNHTNCKLKNSYSTFSTSIEMFSNTKFATSLLATTPKWVQYCILNKNEISFYVFPEYIVSFLFYLKNHVNTQFKQLVDVTAVDYPSRVLRFKVVYNLLSISYNARVRVFTCIHEITVLESVTPLFSSGNWFEREVYDMFGIFFSNHPDLRRILTDYGFQGNPLRKDFPLSGFVEVRYDDSEKRVITEPVEVTQEFRYFDFASPWEQIEKN